MKTKINITVIAMLLAVLMSCSAGRHASAQYDVDGNDEYYVPDNDGYDYESGTPVSMDVFVNELSPYGRWITSPTYGQVWICNEAGFTPYYTGGHWMYTNFGWTWASDYRWGWAPFHYGRWAYEPFYGWMWVPGYEWGPAWVGWRTGGDYYGWAPLAPGINISVGFSFGNYMPAQHWCFVPRKYITNPYIPRYAVDRNRNVTIINNTTIIKNTAVYHNNRYVVGPKRTEVEKVTGNRIHTVRVTNETKPGNYRMANGNKTVQMYRPQVQKNDKLTQDRVQHPRVIQSSPAREVRPQHQQPVIINKNNNDNNRPNNPPRTPRPNIADKTSGYNFNGDQRRSNLNERPDISTPLQQDRIDNRKPDNRNKRSSSRDELVYNDKPNYRPERNNDFNSGNKNNDNVQRFDNNNRQQSRAHLNNRQQTVIQQQQRMWQTRPQPQANNQHQQTYRK